MSEFKQGQPGAPGPQFQQGRPGTTGPQGPMGQSGAPGPQGMPGQPPFQQGPQFQQGRPGPQGPMGQPPFQQPPMGPAGVESVVQRVINPMSGMLMLFVILIGMVVNLFVFFLGIGMASDYLHTGTGVLLVCFSIIMAIVWPIMLKGLRTVGPNEALVLTLFGKYHGTILKQGFFFVNPFSKYNNPSYASLLSAASTEESSESTNRRSGRNGKPVVIHAKKTISLKSMTLDNGTQKVNDVLGNPIIIGAVVLWRVQNPTSAVFNVEDYMEFLSIQTDSTIRNTARLYPYDSFEEEEDGQNEHEEKTLRGSSQEIAERMKEELAQKVAFAGLVIEEVRITHLSYSEEIAAAMLQRQQAAAIIAARTKIVDGAVSMVKMAIDKLNEDDVVTLDEAQKAQMVSNLMVVLCGNKDAQPTVNSGLM